MASAKQKQGEAAFKKIDKVNSELFSLTYGAIVSQLVHNCENIAEVNEQLDQMGYNIGQRIIDEFLAKSGVNRCADFKDSCDTLAQVALPMFLNVKGDIPPGSWNHSQTECSLMVPENPMIDFVELPDECSDLQYSNLLCGVVRGAFEMVSFKVECRFVRDMLKGESENEIRIKLIEKLKSDYAPEEDD